MFFIGSHDVSVSLHGNNFRALGSEEVELEVVQVHDPGVGPACPQSFSDCLLIEKQSLSFIPTALGRQALLLQHETPLRSQFPFAPSLEFHLQLYAMLS